MTSAILLAAAPEAFAALAYDAPAACPSAEALVEALRGRAPDLVEGLDRRRIQVTVAKRGPGFEARLEVDGAGQRDVRGQNCAEAVDAIALILALTLRSLPPAPPPPAPPPPAAAPSSTVAAPAPPPPPDPDVVWAIGLGLGSVGGVVPGVRATVPVFLELRRARGTFAPAARVGLIWAVGGGDPAIGGDARFDWLAAELEPCAGWRDGDWGIDGCARARIGALQGVGGAVDDPDSTWRPWVSVGLAGRVRYAVTRALSIELDLGLSVPVIRDRFYFEPDLTVHRADPVGFSARIQGGWTFW